MAEIVRLWHAPGSDAEKCQARANGRESVRHRLRMAIAVARANGMDTADDERRLAAWDAGYVTNDDLPPKCCCSFCTGSQW